MATDERNLTVQTLMISFHEGWAEGFAGAAFLAAGLDEVAFLGAAATFFTVAALLAGAEVAEAVAGVILSKRSRLDGSG